jgi:hypothetical protein
LNCNVELDKLDQEVALFEGVSLFEDGGYGFGVGYDQEVILQFGGLVATPRMSMRLAELTPRSPFKRIILPYCCSIIA